MKKLSYEILTEVNHGTEMEPQMEQIVTACEIRCADGDLDANLTLARAEAHGEVTVEDISEPAPLTPTPTEQLRADVDYLAIMTEVSL